MLDPDFPKHQVEAYPCYVYVAFVPGYCKVGISVNPWNRVRAIQTGCPLILESMVVFGQRGRFEARKTETWCHRKMRAHFAVGEWFRAEDREVVLALVKRLTDKANIAHVTGEYVTGQPLDLDFAQKAEARKSVLERKSGPVKRKPRPKRPQYGPPAPKPTFDAPEPIRRRLFQRH